MLVLLNLAQMVELVDTPDLGSGAARCGGSSPLLGTLSTLFSLSSFETTLRGKGGSLKGPQI